MRKHHGSISIVTAVTLVFFLAGCGPQDHEDDHGHHHHHGSDTPHGGHLIELEPSDYTAEWTHDDKAEKLTIFILDGEGEKDAPIAADVVKITGELKNKDGELIPFEYPLIAVDPTDEDPPKAFKFENSRPSRDLLTRAKQGEAMKAALEFEVDGKQYKGAIKHDHH